MAFKIKNRKRSRQPIGLIGKTDVLVVWRFWNSWPAEQQSLLLFYLQKFAWTFEEAALLAKHAPDGYTMLAAFRDEASRDRALANIRSTGTGVIKTEVPVPADRGKGYLPLGRVVPESIWRVALDLTCQDQDTEERVMEGIAESMDSRPDGDDSYVFTLSPEVREEVNARRKRKSQ